MKTKRSLRAKLGGLSTILGLTAFTATADAVVITPGNNGAVTGQNTTTNPALAGTVVGSTIVVNKTCFSGNLYVTVQSWVVQETSGTLDFYYRIDSGSFYTVDIPAVDIFNFQTSPWVDADYYLDSSPDVAPDHVTRSPTGDAVHWTFGPPITPGHISRAIFVRTTATGSSFGTGGSMNVYNASCSISGLYRPL